MSYGLRYYFDYYADRDVRVIGGTAELCTTEIYDLNYAGATTELIGAESPVVINYTNVQDNKLQALRGSFSDITLLETASFTLTDLYTENERRWLVKHKRNGSVIHISFIIPDGCQQSFTFTPFPISINTVDGLGLLKNLSFVQNDGNFWLGKMSFFDVIYNCLNRLGIPDMPINTCVNIYEVSMSQGDSFDPLVMTYVDAERYLKDDGINPLNCQEVLQAVLQEWTACIVQSEGEWWIYRPTEAALSGTLVFRKYVDGVVPYDTVTVSKNMDVLLGGESEGTVLAPLFHINTDQIKMIDKPYKTVSISYKYGQPIGVLTNPTMSGASQAGPGDPLGPRDDISIPGWTKFGTVFNGIQSGSVIFYKTTPFDPTNYFINDNSVPVDLGVKLKLTIEYESIPTLTTTDMIFGVELFDGTDIWYLNPDGAGGYDWINENDVVSHTEYISVRSNMGISSAEVVTDVTPLAGIVTVKVYPPDNTSGDIIYNSVDLSFFVQDGDPVGEIHSVEQAGEYSYVPDTINVFNGDDVEVFFYGTMFREDQDTPTTEWVRRGLTESALSQPLEAQKQFLRIAVEEIARLYGSPFVIFEGSIFGYFNPLSRFTINLVTGKFMPVGLSYDLQANICKAVLGIVSNAEIEMDYTLEPDYGETTNITVGGRP